MTIRKHALLLFFWLVCGMSWTGNAQTRLIPDTKSAAIFTYFEIAPEETSALSITPATFNAQMEELANGTYHVAPLAEVIEAFENDSPLPDKTVVLTFDGASHSILDYAAPVLSRYGFPYTVFVASDLASRRTADTLSWDNLRTLQTRTPKVSFGIHPSGYTRLSALKADEIKRQINASIASMRKELDVSPRFIAYPFGDYSGVIKSIAQTMGLGAALGQQSGIAHILSDRYALPRFTITQSYSDMDRFIMAAKAKPLPVSEMEPEDSLFSQRIGFTVHPGLKKSLKSLSCYSSLSEKPAVTILDTRVELRFKTINSDRVRINCTLPYIVSADNGEDEKRWRWFGMMLTTPDLYAQKEDTGTEE